ncbi:aldehyde dehydrogenase family protein, partial [Mesorhizobium sp. M7A.F.Ca.MR.362.00.0.0]
MTTRPPLATEKLSMLIGGRAAAAQSGDFFESFDPFTGKAWALVPRAGVADVDAAVQAAAAAFRGEWRTMIPSARGQIMTRFADLVAEEAENLAVLETRDNGKLINEMRMQCKYIPQWFRFFGGLADKIEGRVIPIDKPGVFN